MNTLSEHDHAGMDGEPSAVVDELLWHCVLAMVVPLWTPVANTAPVTSFNFDEAFKALRALQGRSMAKSEVESGRTLVEIQAQRMALEDRRTKARLAAAEKERQERDQARERQAQKDLDSIGDFSL